MIGAIARRHGAEDALRMRVRPYQSAALDDIAACGTAACGVHRQVCDHCGDQRLVANTCGHRSCPHCQGADRAAWVQAREAELLGCGYFHVIFTLPDPLRDLARLAPRVVLDRLQRASGDAVLTVAADPRHLGAQVGILSVLHTWRRDLGWHPHVHQIVTAGGWRAATGDQPGTWIHARRRGRWQRLYLAPAAVLKAAFRQRLCGLLEDAYQAGDFGDLERFLPQLASATAFRRWLGSLRTQSWCLRIEPPFGSPQILLRYLGAYVNRTAISPRRILAHDPTANAGAGSVTFQISRDHEPGPMRTRTCTGVAFLADFAQHILPPGLRRIRYRGIWATAQRQTLWQAARAALTDDDSGETLPDRPSQASAADTDSDLAAQQAPERGDPCPCCGRGRYRRPPGPCPRPSRNERRRLLGLLRATGSTEPPVGASAVA